MVPCEGNCVCNAAQGTDWYPVSPPLRTPISNLQCCCDLGKVKMGGWAAPSSLRGQRAWRLLLSPPHACRAWERTWVCSEQSKLACSASALWWDAYSRVWWSAANYRKLSDEFPESLKHVTA